MVHQMQPALGLFRVLFRSHEHAITDRSQWLFHQVASVDEAVLRARLNHVAIAPLPVLRVDWNHAPGTVS